jgi:MFS transporter, DHA1 family, inner membrane transport protein
MTEMKVSVPPTLALWVLLFGNFVIGTGVLLPAGLLSQLASELSVSVSTAGFLMLAGGLVVGLGAPTVAALTSKVDRRYLLTFAMVLFGVGHGLSAISPDFWTLLAIRSVMIVAAAIFSPQAAATVGLIVPLEKRSSTIAFIFIGWSAASVVGIPLGGLLAASFGWRDVFIGVALLCFISALGVWLTLPQNLRVAPLNLAAWSKTFTSPALLCVLAVTLCSMAGQFTVFSYLAPILVGAYQGGPKEIATAFAVAGLFGVIGNYFAARLAGRFAVDQVIGVAVFGIALGLGVFALFFGNYVMALVGLGIWGLGSFSSNSLQQSRLVALAPPLASATVALNTAVVYVGQAVGAGVGGFLITGGASAASAWAAAVFLLAALGLSLTASKLKT